MRGTYIKYDEYENNHGFFFICQIISQMYWHLLFLRILTPKLSIV